MITVARQEHSTEQERRQGAGPMTTRIESLAVDRRDAVRRLLKAVQAGVAGVTDFDVAADTMYLDKLFFTAFKTNGKLAASAFYKGTAAHDSSDRIIYDDTTGAVYYDADGTGKAGAILFAKIGAGLALTNADFIIG